MAPKISETTKIKSKFQSKIQKLRVEAKKKHKQLLENVILFIWLHLTVNEVCFYRNFDMKSN